MIHKPVLIKEVLEYLSPKTNENFIDCTVGQGGHTEEILKLTSPDGKVLGIDRDPIQIENCRFRMGEYGERLILVNDSYSHLEEIAREHNFQTNGIFIDLGMSSWHLEDSGKGFSFQKDEPLDMRYSAGQSLTAIEIINSWKREEIESILKEYGEERFARRISEVIVEARKKETISSTNQLVEVIQKAVPLRFQNNKTHFATRTFQALRIAVNQELDNLKSVLPQILRILKPGARIVIISFQSLEDRIVKNFFRDQAKEGLIKTLTKKPIVASFEEIKVNSRSRSAKLRAAIKI